MRALAVAAVLMATGAFAVEPDPAQAPKVFARETLAVTDRVHVIFKPTVTDPPFEGNAIVIEQENYLVAVDAGGSPPSGIAVVQEIKKLSPKPVRYLIYTHYHGDHNLGAGAFKAAWPGVTVISTAKTRENMTGAPMDYVKNYAKSYSDTGDRAQKNASDPALSDVMRRNWARVAKAFPGIVAGYTNMKVYPADITFTDRIALPDEVAPVEAQFLGKGNTDGDAVVWLPKQKVLIAGDLVVAPVPYAAHTFPTPWLDVLGKLKAYDFAFLVPGHGAVQKDKVYLDKVIAALTAVRDQVAPLARANMPLDEVRKRVDVKTVKEGFTGNDPWLSFLMDAVFTGDLISNIYKEARGEPVVQGKG